MCITVGNKTSRLILAKEYQCHMRFVKVVRLDQHGSIKRTVVYLTETAEFEMYARGHKSCLSCGATGRLSKCETCRTAYNCSRECQQDDWVRHKWFCFQCNFGKDVLFLTVSTRGYKHLTDFIPNTIIDRSASLMIIINNPCLEN